MSRLPVKLTLLLFVGVCALVAERPVAFVRSEKDFLIGSTWTRVAGIPNWPLAIGDEVTMSDSPGLVTFRDGTRLLLNSRGKMKIGGKPDRLIVRVLEGSAGFNLSVTAALDGDKSLREGFIAWNGVSFGNVGARVNAISRSACPCPPPPPPVSPSRPTPRFLGAFPVPPIQPGPGTGTIIMPLPTLP